MAEINKKLHCGARLASWDICWLFDRCRRLEVERDQLRARNEKGRATVRALLPVLEAAEGLPSTILTTPFHEIPERLLVLERAIKAARKVVVG